MRDEVLGEWVLINNRYILYLYLYVDGQYSESISPLRYNIFKKELPLALEGLRYGDRGLFNAHTELDENPIVVFFQSKNLLFNSIEYYGMLQDYK